MKQYEIRDKRLVKVWRTLPNDITTNAGAIDFFRQYQEYEREGFLVLYEFETPAEADAARLDFLDSTNLKMEKVWCGNGVDGWFEYRIGTFASMESWRRVIDFARQAPQPTVRVIATPDGPVDPT